MIWPREVRLLIIMDSYHDHPLLLVLSGPSGSGKTTLCSTLMQRMPGAIERTVTCTTRPPRPGEADGQDYHFLPTEQFEQHIADNELYEYARVHGTYYGSLKKHIRSRLKEKDLLLVIDVQGAATLRKAALQDTFLAQRLVTVFIMPASTQVLRERLQGRKSYAGEDMELRLENAKKEMDHWREYDYCLVSQDPDRDYDHFRCLYLAEKMRVRPGSPEAPWVEKS